MNDRTFQVLEFNKVIQLLLNHAATSLGSELIDAMLPSTDFAEVKQMQAETDEAAQILRLDKDIPLGGIFDIRESVKRSSIGSVLTAKESLDVASTIYGGRQVKIFLENIEEDLPLLKKQAEGITSLRDVEQAIKRCIDDNGDVLDQASAALRSIRSSIRSYESRIKERLESFVRNRSNLLSDAIITIRNERYVLPVKHEHRGTIGGIVHDQSSSGQTLFMEPNAIVELNNELQAASIKEKQEIDRILKELSTTIATHRAELDENISLLAKIDLVLSKAKLGQAMRASKPKMNDDGIINMKQARHPLIPMDEVVANDIELGDDYTSILITGPNTGGKTVVLKLVGLCTLMAQSGLQIPALDGCELAVFKHVYADIGDEQSIEQSLSTFSSHMTNIVNIIEHVDDQTLVLFDELGAGTDPQEGASLAMSILDEVISRNARVIATTHYPELKAYGYNRENIINASVEFNSETLEPTYRLLLGVPGRSNAFDISRRLGLDSSIIDRAKSQVDTESRSVEAMISSLESSRKRAEKDYDEAHEVLLDVEKLHKEMKAQWDNFTNKKEDLFRNAEEKAKEALEKAREEAEVIVSEIRSMKSNVAFKEHEWIDAQKALDEAEPKLTEAEKQEKHEEENKELVAGDDVQLVSLNRTGTVVEKISDNEYIVQVGMMRVNVKRKDLQLMAKPKNEKKHISSPVTMIKGSNYHVSTELDLRGERFEDAQQRLEKYIDDALLAGHGKVTIIHGKGTGALRTGVQQFAEKHPHITDFRSGGQGEGGLGVTVIEFK